MPPWSWTSGPSSSPCAKVDRLRGGIRLGGSCAPVHVVRCPCHAYHAGPLEGARRIYRSPATLVVVPQPEHIEHWRYQIRQHVRAEAGLRVLVYTAASQKESRRLGSPLTVERLAWEADVVRAAASLRCPAAPAAAHAGPAVDALACHRS